MRLAFMDRLVKPHLTIVRGEIGQSLGSGAPEKGQFQIERFTPSTADSAPDSKSFLHWGPEGGFLGFFQWQGRHLDVKDVDGTNDLKVEIRNDEQGVAQLSITNGEGEKSTEMEFPIAATEETFDAINALKEEKFSEVEIDFRRRGEKAKLEVELDDQEFEFSLNVR